ncbi:MAG: ATP-binding cassette domain-containing protein [Acidimicrobiales bacterium]
MGRRAWRNSPLLVLGGLLALYLAVPLGAFVDRLATSHQRGFSVPGLYPALYTSAITATISTLLIAAFGIPLAYLLARSRSRWSSLVTLVVSLPLALPPLMAGILLIYIVGPYTTLGSMFNGNLTDSMAGIVLAQTFVASPFLVLVARSAFGGIDPALFDLAAGLGHRELARFWKVGLPGAAEGIRAGLLLAWLRALGEYGATVILAYHPYTLPIFTSVQFSASGLAGTEAPTALALGLAVVVVTLTRVRPRPRRRVVRQLPPPAAPPAVEGRPVAFDLRLRLGSFHLRLAHEGAGTQLAILGPSGSGKTATMRCLAGLYGASPGPVHYGDRDVSRLPVEERRIGYLPQGVALLPHLTVWGQLLFGSGADPAVAAYWLARLGLAGLENRLPNELSGGQRQRVGLAQALSRSPQLLLLDEPFSALDAPVRADLRRELRQLQRETGIATVLVTHDPEEAALLATEVMVIAEGRLLQAGTRREVFGRPSSPEVARLLGIANLLPGTARVSGGVVCGDAVFEARTDGLAPGAPLWWCIRPEQVVVGSEGDVEALVVDVLDLGSNREVALDLGDGLVLRARGSGAEGVIVGARCRVGLPVEAVAVWPREA